MATIEQELAWLARTEPVADDATAEALAGAALRVGARRVARRRGAAVLSTCAVLAGGAVLGATQLPRMQQAEPAGRPTPSGKGSAAAPGWDETPVDRDVFQTAVSQLVPGSHPESMADPADGTSVMTGTGVNYAERHNKAWRAEVSIAVYLKGASAAGTCQDYSSPFRCTETRGARGVLRQVSLPRGGGGGVVTPFTWLTRPDGTTIVLALTGPDADVTRTTLTAQQAVAVVTSPLWRDVVRS